MASPPAPICPFRRGRRALLGEDLDHAAERVGAVQGAQRTVDDFDVVDRGQRNGAPVGFARGRGADPHAVDQHDVLLAVGAADEDRADGARAAVAGDFDAALLLQQVGDGVGAGSARFLPGRCRRCRSGRRWPPAACGWR